MKANDLDLRELLEFSPEGGVIRFGGERALLLDAAALGLLRKELIDTIGLTGARGILTRLGYAHGWRTAEALKTAFPWDDPDEWRAAGGRLHMLQGLVEIEPSPDEGEPGRPFAESTWRNSYEAEQHLLLVGQADEPVCWTQVGFGSGYLSFSQGREFFLVETRCVGKGDAVCHVVGDAREAWGDAIAPHLPFYAKACLDAALEALTASLKKTEQRLRARKARLAHVGGAPEDEEPGGMVARSDAMRQALELVDRAARVDSTVLITGESGVGKERVARRLHERSPRASGPFVAINCGAIPEALVESELFGHAKGSFTGATQDHAGVFEAAGGGTLFLDEVGELPQSAQVKLLRALQEREVRRVGETKSRKVDVRVVSATNRDLQRATQEGTFRQDLLYRLRVIEARLPPLRARREDILPLARTLLVETAERLGLKVGGFTPRAADQLLRYGWPGNVRELENALERALVVMRGDKVDADDLPEEVRQALPDPAVVAPGAVRTLEDVERDYVLAVLDQNGGHRGNTADQLAIGTATLYRKLKQWGRA
jgi:DNA-binding NtrC family response regulator